MRYERLINKWTTTRPYVTLELWPTSLGIQTTTSASIYSEWLGKSRTFRIFSSEWLPTFLIFVSSFQLKTNQKKPKLLPNQSHRVPCFWLTRLQLFRANNLLTKHTWILPFCSLQSSLTLILTNIFQTSDQKHKQQRQK